MKSDIEIAQAATPENITSIASKLDIPKEIAQNEIVRKVYLGEVT